MKVSSRAGTLRWMKPMNKQYRGEEKDIPYRSSIRHMYLDVIEITGLPPNAANRLVRGAECV